MEKLTKGERNACIPVQNVNYEQGKVVWLRKKGDVFKIGFLIGKPVLLIEEGKHEHLGIKSEKIYTILCVLDGDRTYMYPLKEKGDFDRKTEKKED